MSVYFMADIFPDGVLEWISFIAPCLAAAFGVYVLLGIRKSQSPAIGSYGAIALMQTAYLANCLLCLSSFFGDWQAGAYCSLATAVIYIIQMAIVRGHHHHAGR